MPYPVSYQVELPYISLPGFTDLRPGIHVLLHHGHKSVVTVGILDSGSTHTVFSAEIAELLGITDLATGGRARLRSFGGPFDVFLFAVELEVQRRRPVDGGNGRHS